MNVLDPQLSVTITTVDQLIRARQMNVNPSKGTWDIQKNPLEAFLFGSGEVLLLTRLPPYTLTLYHGDGVRKDGYWIGLARMDPNLFLASLDFPERIHKDTDKLKDLRHKGFYIEVLKAFSEQFPNPFNRYMVNTDANRLNAQLHPSLASALPTLQKEALVELCRSWKQGKDRIKPPLSLDDMRRMHVKYMVRTHLERSVFIPNLLNQRIPLYFEIDIAR